MHPSVRFCVPSTEDTYIVSGLVTDQKDGALVMWNIDARTRLTVDKASRVLPQLNLELMADVRHNGTHLDFSQHQSHTRIITRYGSGFWLHCSWLGTEGQVKITENTGSLVTQLFAFAISRKNNTFVKDLVMDYVLWMYDYESEKNPFNAEVIQSTGSVSSGLYFQMGNIYNGQFTMEKEVGLSGGVRRQFFVDNGIYSGPLRMVQAHTEAALQSALGIRNVSDWRVHASVTWMRPRSFFVSEFRTVQAFGFTDWLASLGGILGIVASIFAFCFPYDDHFRRSVRCCPVAVASARSPVNVPLSRHGDGDSGGSYAELPT